MQKVNLKKLLMFLQSKLHYLQFVEGFALRKNNVNRYVY
ncbi:hypothetical protein CULT_1780005 [[Clostridium] ultunense Esp]|nr:hypothetical protein CULT_1780005 [[Clostridium] ultunense Esp]